jgi:alpha-galactosidase
MNLIFKPALFVFLLIMPVMTKAQEQTVVLDNGLVRREIDCSNRHVSGKSFTLTAKNTQFFTASSPEFSVLLDDVAYTGLSDWDHIQSRDTLDGKGGKGVILTLDKTDKKISIEMIYMLYPGLPVVHKAMRITNKSAGDVKVEAVDVEFFRTNLTVTESWVMRQYARYKWLGPYTGNWDDPLIIVHNTNWNRGIAIGNEAVGVIKRTSVFHDGMSIVSGLTHPDQTYGFRKWIRSGRQWTSPWIFIALYENCVDGSQVLNTVIPDFVRKHGGMRIEQLPKKPMFVYNTWTPFRQGINENLIRDLAKAAAECGVEEFIIDDGWQVGPGSSGSVAGLPSSDGDWEVNKKKFPNGLRPVFDYIKSLGMKPGLWISVATADFTKKDYKEHPERFIVDAQGRIANLHTEHGDSKTACMGTDWYDYIKNTILRLVDEHGLAYLKLDLSIATSAYVYDITRTGCYATDHPYHKDREESFGVIYERCMQLFDELHQKAPDLFIDCTFETAGKLQLMDYGFAKHAEGNWLSNVEQYNTVGPLRVRNLAWGRTPAIPATSLVVGNLLLNGQYSELGFKSLTGVLPVMLGDPRKLTPTERQRYKSWTGWLKTLETRHAFMSFRQDLPGFGEPTEGCWDGFCRVNTETGSGGLVGVFRHGAAEESRMVTIPWLNPDKTYLVKQGFEEKAVLTLSGKELAEKGFPVKLTEKYDGELFEVIEK